MKAAILALIAVVLAAGLLAGLPEMPPIREVLAVGGLIVGAYLLGRENGRSQGPK